uniref:Non-specific lipid-transfer protein n=1 Tax=Solanum lycopersicum TaxID=4081 RepID=A0A3Q7HWW6_SOLLC
MTKIACIAVLCMMALVAPHAQAVITCLDVSLHVAVCVPYLTNKGPLGGCCDGVKSLNLLATTTKDRQIICNCLKANANIIAGIDWIKARSLPATCNVNIPYLISAQLDCAKGSIIRTMDDRIKFYNRTNCATIIKRTISDG